MRNVESREYSPSQPADRRALAEIDDLIDSGAYEAAGVMAWDVQRAAPGDPVVWLQLTRIDYLRERYAGAMYAARMATRLDPSSADAWLWLARAGATRSRWRTEALDAALQATALGSEDPRTWTVLAELHLARDARYEAAIAAERAVRVGPTDVAAHRTLGEIAVRAGEWSHAVAAFRHTLELDPDDDRARAGLAESLRAQGIDPADELASFGGGVPEGRGVGARVRTLAKRHLDLSDPGPLTARRGGLLLGVAACVVVGVLVGLLAPGLGAVRGLVGATALALMWIALWPLQRRPAHPHAPVAATAGGVITSTRPGRSEASSDDSVLLGDRRAGRGRRRETARASGRDSTRRGERETPEPAPAAEARRAPQGPPPPRAPRTPATGDDAVAAGRGDDAVAAGRGDDAVAAGRGDDAPDAESGSDDAAVASSAAARASAGRARAMRARADRDRLGRMTRPGGRGGGAGSDPDGAAEPGDGDGGASGRPAVARRGTEATPGDAQRADAARSRPGAGDATPQRPGAGDATPQRRSAGDAAPRRSADEVTASGGGRTRGRAPMDQPTPVDQPTSVDQPAPAEPPAPADATRTGAAASGAAAGRDAENGAAPPAGDEVQRPAAGAAVDGAAADHLPSDPDELVRLAAAKLAEFDIDAARVAAQRLAEVDPGSIAAHRALGAVSLAAQEYVQAEEHYGRVLDIEPLDQEAHERLAMARKGRHREQQPQRHRRRKG